MVFAKKVLADVIETGHCLASCIKGWSFHELLETHPTAILCLGRWVTATWKRVSDEG